MSKYPKIEYDPGITWTSATFSRKVAKIGYNVIVNAGIIGSENNLDINVMDKNMPKLKIIDI